MLFFKVKLRMFERPDISVEEGYLVKRVLRGFMHVRALTLWKVSNLVKRVLRGFMHVRALTLWKVSNLKLTLTSRSHC